MNIAVLLTCHNRREKSKKCLQSLKEALEVYNDMNEKVRIEIFMTDDGCTDDTVVVARDVFPDENVLHILKGDGTLYWAGGMRFCWREAMKRHKEWDYYLLLNDDVEVLPNLFDELFLTQQWIYKKYNNVGICSGVTCALDNPNKRSFGGRVWVNKLFATTKPLEPTGEPQLCDLTNANILLVPNEIVCRIGIFYEGYHHGHADYDYGNMASKAGYPVVITAHFCGRCENEHVDRINKLKQREKIINMPLKNRIEYFKTPLHSNNDYMLFIRRVVPLRFPLVWLGRKMNIFFPKLYYKFKTIEG